MQQSWWFRFLTSNHVNSTKKCIEFVALDQAPLLCVCAWATTERGLGCVLCFDCFYVGPASFPMLDQGLVVHDCSSCLLYACMHWTKARLVGVGGCWCVLRSCFVLEVGWFVSLFCVFKLHWLRVSLVCRCLCETFFMLHFSWQGHRLQRLYILLEMHVMV